MRQRAGLWSQSHVRKDRTELPVERRKRPRQEGLWFASCKISNQEAARTSNDPVKTGGPTNVIATSKEDRAEQ